MAPDANDDPVHGEKGLRPTTVLIVDDDEDIRDLFRQALARDPDIRVIGAAASGREAIETSIARTPDVVVMDYVLPDMNGASAIEQIKAQLPDTHVISVSGLSAPGAYQAAAAAGSSAWIRKTSAVRELKAAIHRVVKGDSMVVADEELLPSLGELVLHYQSVQDLATGAIVGWESLVRWGHPSGTLRTPDEFVARAESVGRVSDLDRRVSEVAARQLSDWQIRHPTKPQRWISVNLSPVNLRRPDLREWVGASVAGARIDAGCLVLELKETALIDDPQETSRRLAQLKDVGVTVAIDGFGRTFTSLRNIRDLPVDILKFDRSCITELPESLDQMRRMERLRREMEDSDLIGIAEGIERAEQVEALRSLGWSLGQGFLLARPEPAEICEAALARSPSASE